LIRGVVLFIGFGLFFFSRFCWIFSLVEANGRAVLFWTFVGVEVLLFAFYCISNI
jgi:hypothetical protein